MKPLVASTLCCTLMLVAMPSAGGEGPRLSPKHWPPGDLASYTELNLNEFREHPRALGSEAMLVGTSGALAVRSGLEALRQGGSAADAAIVTALAQTTLAAGSWVSFAGVWSIIYYEADTGGMHYIDGAWNTVLGENDPLSIPADQPSGRSALVPGFMAAVEATHEQFGTLPFKSLFKPAIFFAKKGFTMDRSLAAGIEFRRDVLSRRPETRKIFFKPNGDGPQEGQKFKQKALAKTLKKVAKKGAKYMYRGKWAQNLVDVIQEEGGNMTLEDLSRYETISTTPEKGPFRSFKVHGPATPGTGGDMAKSTLKRLQSKNLAGLGHYTESSDALYELIKATRKELGLAERDSSSEGEIRLASYGGHSDGVVAVDQWGNVAAVLHSINTRAWGLTGIFVDGVSIADPAAFQQQRVANAGPGNRVPHPDNPLIVTRNGKPVLATSAVGSGLFEATMQSVINVLEYGLDPKETADTVMFRAPNKADSTHGFPQRVTQGDFDPDLIDAVRARGIPIQVFSQSDPVGTGYWIGVTLDPDTGELVGATTNSFNGHAEGY